MTTESSANMKIFEDAYFRFVTNFFIFIILAFIIWVFYKMYYLFKDKQLEDDLFDTRKMDDEERKLFLLTQKLTKVNRDNIHDVQKLEDFANQSKFVYCSSFGGLWDSL